MLTSRWNIIEVFTGVTKTINMFSIQLKIILLNRKSFVYLLFWNFFFASKISMKYNPLGNKYLEISDVTTLRPKICH